MGWSSGDPGRLDFQEVQNSLTQVSEADLRRAERIAAFLAHGLPGINGEDLLQEVYIKLLSGDRRFPRGVRTLHVLKSAMESEASNARKGRRASPIDLRYQVGVDADSPDRRSPEVELLASQQLESLLATCAGDADAELVVTAWADGLSGAEAREATGLGEKAFDAARKRATRRLAGFEMHGGMT